MANLEDADIKRKDKSCTCRSIGTGFTYSLPIPLGLEVLSYLINFGTPSINFEKTSLLKIETPDFSITGLKKLKQINFTLKNKDKIDLLQTFEEDIVKYVKENKIER